MTDHTIKEPISENSSFGATATAAIVTSVAAYGALRTGNYRVVLQMYTKGGGGLNLYKQIGSHSQRVFALDYHPFWNKASQAKEWKLHYHRGKTKQQIKEHRPYDGHW
ncbi:hypothetical protein ACD661_00145 [Legionella lytica]|uniref:Uncharacterized protein n=1 Tax=Legionella lytica TaxID=96232 RepID=A0ABW8D2N0_9GAMM